MDIFVRFFITFQLMFDIVLLLVAGYYIFKRSRISNADDNSNNSYAKRELEELVAEISTIMEEFKENYKEFRRDYRGKMTYLETLYEEIKSIDKAAHERGPDSSLTNEQATVLPYLDKQKQVLELKEKKGMNTEQIAKSLGISTSEVDMFLKLTKCQKH